MTDIKIPEVKIDVVEPNHSARKGHIEVEIDKQIIFSTEGIQYYAYKSWESIIYDSMVVTAAIEYGDRILKRPTYGWARSINIRIPVHNPDKWNMSSVYDSLHDAIQLLTGDYWKIEFIPRSKPKDDVSKTYLPLDTETKAVLAYSDGLDSHIVASLSEHLLGDKLLRVRVGKGGSPKQDKSRYFTKVPYNVEFKGKAIESSARNRGFRFSMISSIAAYLTKAEEIIIPESGQGAIGPAIINVGHSYLDYRNHPQFTKLMEKFVNSLFGTNIRFIFPKIWNTKGETLSEYIKLPSNKGGWEDTKSCWKGNQWSSVNGKHRQCGICAACMLRRVSVHAAGLIEDPDKYICTNLNATSLDDAIDQDFTKKNQGFVDYAIGGILFMNNLAKMAEKENELDIKRYANSLASSLGISKEEAEVNLFDLINKHSQEWNNYLDSLSSDSFIKKWVGA